MKILNLGFCCCCFFFLLFGTAAAQSGFPKIELPNVKRFGFFIFGDSSVDGGNNNYVMNATSDCRANFPPHGETFFHIPTGRFCDGRIIPDFLTEYAEMPFIKAYLDPNNDNHMNGVNFASGGAGVLAETNQETAIGLQTQMKFFKNVEKSLRKKLGNETSQSFLSNSVFLFNFGGNDYIKPFNISHDILKTIDAQQQLVNMVIGNMTIALKKVFNYGGRKFGILGLPPTGYLPSSRLKRIEQFFQETSSIARIHNKMFYIALQKLFADTHTFLLQRILNPTKYGNQFPLLIQLTDHINSRHLSVINHIASLSTIEFINSLINFAIIF
ncbi:unnamed protein product [Citrullus colocynthis]|uniref:Uncharacterized protein n=1 Tax=Citrullus colocynthis TaxID=252529 RepID=A0ABP0YBF8_9ROSI